jgi:MYXO-CTERM domain-containing protein
MTRSLSRALVAASSLLVGAAPAAAAVAELTPADDVEAAINAALPGDEIVLSGGTYALTERFGISVSGTVEAPVIVRAKDGERPILHREGADQNVIDVDVASYVVFRGLEVSGGSHGLRLIDAQFVTIEECEIHGTADVALSANSGDSYEGLRILRNHIHDTSGTGEGMYLGCNEDACRVFDSLIEGNYVHHTNGPNVEQGDGIELKEGSYGNVVRDNVIHDTNYPCILTYGTVGNGAPNVIERNLMWNCGDHAIQSAADAVIRNNIILGARANGIAMQPHQSGTPANLLVVHNTVLHPSNDAISVSGISGSVLIANNALYAPNGAALNVGGGMLDQLVVAGNFGLSSGAAPDGFDGAGELAVDFVAARFSGEPPNDVFPATGSGLLGAGDPAHVTDDDFNGTPRDGIADVGAYRFDAAGNPGWPLAPGPKSEPAVAGSGGSSQGGGDSRGGAPVSGSGAGEGAGGAALGGSVAALGGRPNGADAGTSLAAASKDGGCGCRVGSAHNVPGTWWFFGGALAALLGRRNRTAVGESKTAPRVRIHG